MKCTLAIFAFLCIGTVPPCIAQEEPTMTMAVLRADTSTFIAFCNRSTVPIKVPYALMKSHFSESNPEELLVYVDTLSSFHGRTTKTLSRDSVDYLMAYLDPGRCHSIYIENCDPRRVKSIVLAVGRYRERIVVNSIVETVNPFFVQRAR